MTPNRLHIAVETGFHREALISKKQQQPGEAYGFLGFPGYLNGSSISAGKDYRTGMGSRGCRLIPDCDDLALIGTNPHALDRAQRRMKMGWLQK